MLAGIAAVDAACCRSLGRRSRSQDHRDAVALVRQVAPGGPEAAKQLGISEATFHRWRNQYGGMKADAMKRLKELEAENARLKKIVADQAVDDIDILKEVNRKNF